jgi:hypothetical protein
MKNTLKQRKHCNKFYGFDYSIASTSSRCSTPTTSLQACPAAGNTTHSPAVASSVASSSPKHATLLSQILAWQLVPQTLYTDVPVAPSLMYGAIHLARLFGMGVVNLYSDEQVK